MITNISGTLLSVEDNAARLQVGPFQYTILIPEGSRRNLQGRGGDWRVVGVNRLAGQGPS